MIMTIKNNKLKLSLQALKKTMKNVIYPKPMRATKAVFRGEFVASQAFTVLKEWY